MLKKVKSHHIAHSPKSNLNRRYNWLPDKPSHHDPKFKLIHSSAVTLPALIDLKPYCSPVFNQGDIGSCTGNALAGAFEFMQLKEIRNKQITSPEEFGGDYAAAARLFIYWYERYLEGDVNQDGGAQIRDGVRVLSRWGCCTEALWPYADSNLFTQPIASAMAQAGRHKVGSYSRLEDLNDMKTCLAFGYPFVFGFTVFESFESAAVAATGNVPMPGPNESILGGHAVMAVGYNDEKQWFTVRNSWGADWGLGGYFHLPYAYLTNQDLASDLWTIRK